MRRWVGGVALVLVLLAVSGPAAAQPGKKGRPESVVNGRPISSWVKDLTSGKSEQMVPAINALMRAGPEARPAVPALVRILTGEPSFTQLLAVLVLARIGPDAVPELRKALDSKSAKGRELAARALGVIGDPSAVSGLVARLKEDKDDNVRRSAATALRQMSARPALPALRAALDDADPEVRVEAAWAVWHIGNEARGVPVLTRALKEKDEDLLTRALSALRDMGPKAKDAADAVAALLKHDNVDLRLLAAQTHHRLTGKTDGLAVVTAALKDAETKQRAAAALAEFRATDEAGKLAAVLLADREANVRREAATWAGPSGLEGALNDPDLGVRWWAALGLLSGKGTKKRDDDGLLLELRAAQGTSSKGEPNSDAVLNVLASERAAPALAAILTDGPARYHADAARALALPGMDARPALDALLTAIRSDDSALRRAAAEALAGIGPEQLPRLRKLLDDTDPKVRESAARTIGRIGVPARSLTAALAGRLRDMDAGVRTQAALALWSVDAQSEAPLKVLDLVLKDVDNKDRWEAIEAIGVIATEAIPTIRGLTEVLVNALKDRDPRVRAVAAKWLWRRVKQAKPVMPLLRDVLGGRDAFARLVAVETLGELDPEASPGPVLLAALEERDQPIRLAAIEGLARQGDPGPLVKAMVGKSPRTRDGARRALERMGPAARQALPELAKQAVDRDGEAAGRLLGRLFADREKLLKDYLAAVAKKDDLAVKKLEKALLAK